MGLKPNSEQLMAALKICLEALEIIRLKYGSNIFQGKYDKAFHNLNHTLGVLSSAIKICDLAIKNGLINQFEKLLIIIAACFHDIEQDFERNINEDKSAQMAADAMRKTGVFSEDAISIVEKLIRATKIYFVEGVMYQSSQRDILSNIMCDADLATAGKVPATYWKVSLALLREIKQTIHLSKNEIREFAKSQITFLNNHSFYTEEAKILFPYKQDNIKYTQSIIDSQ